MIEDYIKPMGYRVYGEMALLEEEKRACILAKWIKRINTREIIRGVKSLGFDKAEKLHNTIAVLVEAGWLKPDFTRVGLTKGKKSKSFAVNPLVL